MTKRLEFFFLLLLLAGAFCVRLYRFQNPIADWHSWRQTDTSAVSRNFVTGGFDVLHPRYSDISNVQSGFDNPQGYRFVEFPLFNIFQAGLFTLFHHFTLEEWGRLVTIFSSVFSTLFIFLLSRKYANWIVACFAAIFFAVDPYSIYYGRTILPDTSMAMAILGGIYFFDKWMDAIQGRKFALCSFLLAVIFTTSSLLLRPFAIFFSLPLFYIAWKKYRWGMLKHPLLWLFLILSVTPLIWWRWWISHYPEGIPASLWLLNGGNIRFTGAYFYWIFAERISKLLLGYWGIVVVCMGFLGRFKNNTGFFFSFLLSSLAYVIVIARGNVQHDYYQILILPTIAIFFGLGAEYLVTIGKSVSEKITYSMILFITSIFMLMFGWYQVRDYFNINNPAIITAGAAIDRLTPKNAKVVAPLDGDTTLLYYTKRKGWPSFEHSLEDLIKLGAGYLVLLHPTDQDRGIGKTYRIIADTSDYILFDLHQKPLQKRK